MLFFKSKHKIEHKTYDAARWTPVVKSSICTGEKVAGFQDKHTGRFQEDMYIRSEDDLDKFKEIYGISGEIKTIY